jgi:hypothetical protein
MNVSMTPIDTLGRMLHSFTCQAYEIAECTFNNLITLGLTSLPASNTTSLRVGQVSLRNIMRATSDILALEYPDFLV